MNDVKNGRALWQSQNFLRKPEFVASLVKKAEISHSDFVVEIGLGKGIITQQLASKASKVIAVEIVSKLAKNLQISSKILPMLESSRPIFCDGNYPKKPTKFFQTFLLI